MADDAGGLPSAVHVSELLRAAAWADPLIDVEVASSVDLRGPADGIDIPHEVCTEGHELPQDSGEAIVVGLLAPWFLGRRS